MDKTAVEPFMRLQVEASSALNGIGLVRLMGRSSGFITMEASMASGVLRVPDPTLTLSYPSNDYAELTGCLLRRDRRGRHLPHSRGGLRRACADGAGKDSVGTERPHCGGTLRSHICVSSHCLRHGKTWLNIRLPFCEAAFITAPLGSSKRCSCASACRARWALACRPCGAAFRTAV